jgi:hypothetical protein
MRQVSPRPASHKRRQLRRRTTIMSGGKESYQGRGSREIETHRTGNRIPGSPSQTLKKEVPDVDVLHLQQDEGQVFFIRSTR